MQTPKLPGPARVILRLLPADDRDVVYGDFLQSHAEHRRRSGKGAAWIRTCADVVLFFAVFTWSTNVRSFLEVIGALGEVRIAVRRLFRERVSTATSLLILGFGMAVATSVFSVLYAVVLSPLPFDAPDRLVVVWTGHAREVALDGNSYQNMASWSEAPSLAETGFFYRPEFTQRTVTGGSTPYRVQIGAVDAGFFSTLGVAPVLGRAIEPEDELTRAPVVVLSHDFWLRVFGGDASAIGATIELDGSMSSVIGVMPRELSLPMAGTQLWEPHSRWTAYPDSLGPRTEDLFGMVGRLTPAASLPTLRAELAAIDRDLASSYPAGFDGYTAVAGPLVDEVVGTDIRDSIWLIVAAAVALFFSVSANVGQLWTTRGLGRAHELAVRSALGASRGRLGGMMFLEAALLSLAAAVLALSLAGPLLEVLVGRIPIRIPRIEEVGLQPPVVVFTLLVGTLTPPLVALVPMVRASFPRLVVASGRAPGLGGRGGARTVLAVSQLGLATVLVVTGSVLVRSLDRAATGDRGVDTEGAWVARVTLPSEGYPTSEERWRFFNGFAGEVGALNGVQDVAVLSDFVIRRHAAAELHVPDRDSPADIAVMADAVLPGFEDALGLRLVSGRALTTDDRWRTGNGWPVAVNRTLAERVWPGQDAVGQEFMLGSRREGKPWFRVVGVVEDDRRRGLDRATWGHMYHVLVNDGMDIVVRTESEAASLRLVIDRLRSIDPTIASPVFVPAAELLDETIALRRTLTWLVSFAGLSTVALALLGVFGLLTEGVAARRSEIGLRVALGAGRRAIVLSVLRRGMVLTAVGVGVGLVGAMGTGLIVREFTFETSAWDPLSMLATAVTIGALVAVATVVPAHRAATIDPVRAIQAEP